jgi:hypothetical protein
VRRKKRFHHAHTFHDVALSLPSLCINQDTESGFQGANYSQLSIGNIRPQEVEQNVALFHLQKNAYDIEHDFMVPPQLHCTVLFNFCVVRQKDSSWMLSSVESLEHIECYGSDENERGSARKRVTEKDYKTMA